MALNMEICVVAIFLMFGELQAQANLALTKTTLMYHDYRNGQRAVDGSHDCEAVLSLCYCSRTVSNPAWWVVDLEAVYTVGSVVITTSQDEQLLTPSICMLDAMPSEGQNDLANSSCESDLRTIGAGSTQAIAVDLEGQYLAIIAANNLVDICEVEVYESSAQDTTAASVDEAEMSVPSSQSSSVYYSVTSGARINSVVLDTAVVASPLECALKCMRRADCENFNYKANGNICEWLSQSEPLSEVAESEWVCAAEIN